MKYISFATEINSLLMRLRVYYYFMIAFRTALFVLITLILKSYLGFWLGFTIATVLGILLTISINGRSEIQEVKANLKQSLRKHSVAILIILFIFLLLVGIAVPIYKYWENFRHAERSTDPADWGTFGDYFGGILNPFISLLTLSVTIFIAYYLKKADEKRSEREKDLAYSPQLILQIDRAYIYALKTPEGFYSPVEVLIENIPFSNYEYVGRTSFGIPVLNLGLGIAKKIEAKVKYDFMKIIQVLDEMNKKQTKYPVDIKYVNESEMLLFKGPGNNGGANRVNQLTKTKLYYVQSVSKASNTSFVKLPPALISLFLTYVYHSWLYNIEDKTMPKFPSFTIDLTYQDVEDKVHSDSLEVQFIYTGGTATPKSVFEIVVNEV